MQSHDVRLWDVRALLASTGTPFAVAEYGPRAIIFHQGDECRSVMHIERGRVRMAITTRGGKEAICGILGAGAFLGEEALGGFAVRRQTATALNATTMLIVAKADMMRRLRTQPAIADRFIAYILQRNSRLEADLTDQLLHSSEQRLARALCLLAGCDERRPGPGVLPDVSQTLIAEMVGTTRSRVNTLMGKFKKQGFIEQDGGVLQVKPALMRVVPENRAG